MDVSPLENLALKYGNKVVYDSAGGVAGVFVRFPKMKSSELDPSLPNHTHPAFIVNGVEQDAIWLGKYKASNIDGNGDSPVFSLPGADPAIGAANDLLARIRSAGSGISGMTVADAGFLLLLAQKEGWTARGNTATGCCHLDGSVWKAGDAMAVDEVRLFKGWTYTCIQAHTTSAALKPDISPEYWRRDGYIGGVMCGDHFNDIYQCTYHVVGGSGPLSWFLGGDPASLWEPIGSTMDIQYGYVVTNGELRILANNDAASPDADLSATSAAWKAILPHAGDDGYDLVAPGTAGTLHWTWQNSKITLDTVEPTFDSNSRRMNFRQLAVNSANLPYVPCIVRELGLFPTNGSVMPGSYQIAFTQTERMPCRGGGGITGGYSGLGYIVATNTRTTISPSYGSRPRWMQT